MYTQEMINCCAITIICAFGHDQKGDIGPTKKEVQKYLQKEEKQHLYNKGGCPSILMANLNGSQMAFLKDVFKEEGWKIAINKAYHPGHRSKITVLVKSLYGEEE